MATMTYEGPGRRVPPRAQSLGRVLLREGRAMTVMVRVIVTVMRGNSNSNSNSYNNNNNNNNSKSLIVREIAKQ